jgi:hypothetical protein
MNFWMTGTPENGKKEDALAAPRAHFSHPRLPTKYVTSDERTKRKPNTTEGFVFLQCNFM